MRRHLLWSLIVLLAALLVITGGYRALMLHMDGELDRLRNTPDPKYQRLIQSAPDHPETQP